MAMASTKSYQLTGKIIPKSSSGLNKMPPIPQKVRDDEEEAEYASKWYYLKSPREVFGALGPQDLKDIRQLYQEGIINDDTLLWKEGYDSWKPMSSSIQMKNEILNPSAKASHRTDISEAPEQLKLASRSPIKYLSDALKYRVVWECVNCGHPGISNTPLYGDQYPNLVGLQTDAGSTSQASEVIPGFLWIGNSSTAKSKVFEQMKITLAINCSEELKNIDSKPPLYRCKYTPLECNATTSSTRTIKDIISIFEITYDWIERERLHYDGIERGDPLKPEYRGPTDQYGFPIKRLSAEYDKIIMKWPTPRVLLYSKLGFDGPCAITVAYLIKRCGMRYHQAVETVTLARPGGITVGNEFQEALEEWSKVHSLGYTYCNLCLEDRLFLHAIEKNTFKISTSIPSEVTPQDLEEANNTLQEILQLHNPKSPKLLLFEENIQFNSLLQPLGQPYDYLLEINTHHANPSTMSTSLYDLSINGQNMNDDQTIALFEALLQTNIIEFIRVISLVGNNISGSGIEALVAALTIKPGELIYLNLAHNKIGESGASAIATLLRCCKSLLTLDVTDNLMGDAGCLTILTSLELESEFEDDDDEELNGQADSEKRASLQMRHLSMNNALRNNNKNRIHLPEIEYSYNSTLIDLKIGNNGFGPTSSDKLVNVVKSNAILTSLNLDCNVNIPPLALKKICIHIRSFNLSLQKLSLSDIPLTVNVASQIFWIFASENVPLNWLCLSGCGLTSKHMSTFTRHMASTCSLTYLDVSRNKINDEGIAYISEILGERVGVNGIVYTIPLKHFDLSCCGISAVGALTMADAITAAETVKYLDLSDNNLGTEMDDFADAISKCRLVELKLNRCKLGTKGAISILTQLSITTADKCGSTLKNLILSENNIHDPVGPTLKQFLEINMVIQNLDLGFNCLTSALLTVDLKDALAVKSESTKEKKVFELNIVMIGNPCDPCLLDLPGCARSKVSLRALIQKTRNIESSTIPNDRFSVLNNPDVRGVECDLENDNTARSYLVEYYSDYNSIS